MLSKQLNSLPVRVHFGALENLLVPQSVVTTFIYRLVKVFFPMERRIVLIGSLAVAITSERKPLSELLTLSKSDPNAEINTNA